MLIPARSPGVRPLTLGLELEFVAYGEKSDIKRAINRLKTQGISAIGDWGGDAGVEKWSVWLVTTDSSVATLLLSRNGIMARAIELVSPILKDDGVEAVGGWRTVVVAVLEAIRAEDIGIFTNKDTKTGLHVHVGVGRGCEFTLDEVKKICMLFVAYEMKIDQYHASHRRAEPQCKSNRKNCVLYNRSIPDALQGILRCRTLKELTLAMCPSGLSSDGTVISADRQYKLNLLSLDLHGTLEWRQHDGTTDASVACGWADFVLHFVRSALSLSFDEIKEHARKRTPLVPTFVPDNLCSIVEI